jgi:hypothetical protein
MAGQARRIKIFFLLVTIPIMEVLFLLKNLLLQ